MTRARDRGRDLRLHQRQYRHRKHRRMISEDTLRRAVDRALISREQAGGLRALALEERLLATTSAAASAPPVRADDEALRFITGFADIFVTIGILLFLGALFYLAAFVPGSGWRASAVLPLGAWLLAEFFTRKRRMALPSIVLLVIFLGGAFLTLAGALEPAGWPCVGRRSGAGPMAAVCRSSRRQLRRLVLAVLHYLRFRVPITIAGGTAALGLAVFAAVYSLFPNLPGALSAVLLLILGISGLRSRHAFRSIRSGPSDATDRHRLLAAPPRGRPSSCIP